MDAAFLDTQVLKYGERVVVGQARGVVVAAEVTEEEVAEAGMHEAADGIAAGVVREVAGTLADAHLEVMRVGAAEEHVHVEIRLHHHCIGLGGPVHSLVRHVAQVGHQDEQMSFASDGIADGLGGVMRYLKVLDLDTIGDRVPGVRLQVPPATTDFQMCKRIAGQGVLQDRSGIHRLGEAFADGAEVADMVAMVVGDEDRLETVEIQGQALENPFHPADAHTGVDENAGRGHPRPVPEQEVTVAAAAAGKTQEPHQFESSSQYREITL